MAVYHLVIICVLAYQSVAVDEFSCYQCIDAWGDDGTYDNNASRHSPIDNPLQPCRSAGQAKIHSTPVPCTDGKLCISLITQYTDEAEDIDVRVVRDCAIHKKELGCETRPNTREKDAKLICKCVCKTDKCNNRKMYADKPACGVDHVNKHEDANAPTGRKVKEDSKNSVGHQWKIGESMSIILVVIGLVW